MPSAPQPAGFFAATVLVLFAAGSGANSTKHCAWPGPGAAHADRYPAADAPDAPPAAGSWADVSEVVAARAPTAGVTSSAARCAAVSPAAATVVCVANA